MGTLKERLVGIVAHREAPCAACPVHPASFVSFGGLTQPIIGIRLTLDQRILNDWNLIDAVRLIGLRVN